MTLLKLSAPFAPAADTTHSSVKRIRQWRNDGKREASYHAPLDVARVQRVYGPETGHDAREHSMVFRVPVGISAAQYERLRNERISQWLEIMRKSGWDWVTTTSITVDKFIYPARFEDGFGSDLSRREMKATTTFTHRNPGVVRIDLPPALLEPIDRRPGTHHVPTL